jgi:hypothetical protein
MNLLAGYVVEYGGVNKEMMEALARRTFGGLPWL